jgi:hypothetical protein
MVIWKKKTVRVNGAGTRVGPCRTHGLIKSSVAAFLELARCHRTGDRFGEKSKLHNLQGEIISRGGAFLPRLKCFKLS